MSLNLCLLIFICLAHFPCSYSVRTSNYPVIKKYIISITYLDNVKTIFDKNKVNKTKIGQDYIFP